MAINAVTKVVWVCGVPKNQYGEWCRVLKLLRRICMPGSYDSAMFDNVVEALSTLTSIATYFSP